MAREDGPDRRTFLKTTALALAAQKFHMSHSWQRPLHRIEAPTLADELSALEKASVWINTPPLTRARFTGKVVLVQFWTFTCINWRRTLPYVRHWAQAYKDSGLVVIGVHTPEFAFEHNVENVRRAAAEMNVDYPVAVDSEYAIWRGFDNQYWPALYLFDAKGRVRHHQFGEGAYPESERMIEQLLTDTGARDVPQQLAAADGRGIEEAADWDDLRSAENYVGSERSEGFASPGGAATGPHSYTAPRELRLNQWALDGDWTVDKEAITLNRPNGRIACRFHGRDLHLVMGPPTGARAVRFRVRLDGRPVSAAHGVDVDEQGLGVATQQRLYQLIRQPQPIVDRLFEIEFLDEGIEAFSFTFG